MEAVITKAAEHEQELMKSDFVRLSWNDVEYHEIPAGVYVIPYPDENDLDGNPIRYTLFRSYRPEETSQGYRYDPQFQHPKMRLDYIPFLFDTKDAAGNDVKKSEYEYIGSLRTLAQYLCDYINDSLDTGGYDFHLTKVPVDGGIDLNETVTVTFSNDSIQSAIQKVCDTVGCEYHLEWMQRLFYFGNIYLGATEYELVVNQNVDVPKVTNSTEKTYNRYYVQGGTRNNARQTEHGNIALNTRLLLDPVEYPDSIIDTREQGEQGPDLTGILTFDDVYPHLELYVYDIHERQKYKLDADGNVTSERWSVWYFKMAYRSNNQWVEFKLLSDPRTKITNIAPDSGPVGTDLRTEDYGFPVVDMGTEKQMVIDLRVNGASKRVGIRAKEDTIERLELYPLKDDSEMQDFLSFKQEIAVDDELPITDDIDLSILPYANVTTHAIDGLAPSIGFMVNEASGAEISSLGTREFEIIYNTKPVTFDMKDDVAGQTGLPAGYYEIVHTTEGSNELIVPTTSEEGIIPRGGSEPSLLNNKVQLFNVVIGDEYKAAAQEELELRAKTEIVRLKADQNQYTFNSNKVWFEEEEPWMYLGRRVIFDDGAGYRITSRITKLVTKLDYDFETEITVANRLMKKFSDEVMAKIAALGNRTGGYETIEVAPSAQTVTYVEYSEWISGTPYYYETINRSTGLLETSYVWHRGCLWMCLRTLTTDEPWFTSSDWKCVRANNISLGFYTVGDDPMPIYGLSVRPASIDEYVQPYLLIGQEDISSIVTDWSWERNENATPADMYWSGQHSGAMARTLHLTTEDFPSGWDVQGGRVSFRCTATFQFDTDNAQISNQITVQ